MRLSRMRGRGWGRAWFRGEFTFFFFLDGMWWESEGLLMCCCFGRVMLSATHESALRSIRLEDLRRFAVDGDGGAGAGAGSSSAQS